MIVSATFLTGLKKFVVSSSGLMTFGVGLPPFTAGALQKNWIHPNLLTQV